MLNTFRVVFVDYDGNEVIPTQRGVDMYRLVVMYTIHLTGEILTKFLHQGM